MKLPTHARWIDRYSPCIYCRKPAVGMLMSDRNDRIGSCCAKCGEKAISGYQVPRPPA